MVDRYRVHRIMSAMSMCAPSTVLLHPVIVADQSNVHGTVRRDSAGYNRFESHTLKSVFLRWTPHPAIVA